METVISIILTSIIAIVITWYFTRKQMKKNEITHFSINSYDIGKGLSDEFPEFKLHFGGDILADNVMVLKGGFMNTGRNDINALKGDADIKLILPDGCTLKAVKVTPSTEELIVSTNKNDENVIPFGIAELFKSNEFFLYTAIVETSKEIKNISGMIKFQHRILNTDIINTHVGLSNVFIRRKTYKWFKRAIAILSLLFLLFIPLSIYHKMEYEVYDNTTNKQVKLYIDRNSQIHVADKIFIPYIYEGETISTEEMKNNYRISPVTTFKWYNYHNVITFALFIFTLLYIAFCYFFLFKRYVGGVNRHIIDVIYPISKKK